MEKLKVGGYQWSVKAGAKGVNAGPFLGEVGMKAVKVGPKNSKSRHGPQTRPGVAVLVFTHNSDRCGTWPKGAKSGRKA